MSDELQGMVRAVVTTQAGGVGLTWTGNTLVVDDAHDFPRDGGQFKAEGYETVFNYVSVTDGETEDDPDTITTVETAPGAFTDEFRLDLWPGAVSSVAEVAMPEALEDTVPAIIPHSLKPFLVDGVRDPEAQESVLIAQRDMAWYVVDILGQPEVLIPDLVTAVDDAKAEALEAHTLASDATVAAQDAHNAAVTAQDAAAAASATAGTAQAAADAAAQDAADAAGIAGGKADVLIQSGAPAAAYQAPTTLWIDTTGGANTPKRWNGSAWVVVTDKAATDAAAAAATAQTTASNAASAAATAQTTANDAAAAAAAAQTAAGNAQTTATNALTSANGRNSRVTSTSAPSGTTNPNTGLAWVDGDTWWQWDNTTNKNVIGAWTRRAGAWAAEKIADAVLASLDLNKLTVSGSARMAQAVVDKIIGDAAFFKVITADRIQLQSSASVYYDGQFNDPGLSALRASNSGFTYSTSAKTMTGTGSFWLTYNALDEGLTMPLIVGQKYLVRVTGTGLTSGNYAFAVRDSAGYTVRATTYTATGMEFVLTPTTTLTRVNVYSQSSNSATIERVEFAAMVGSTIIEPGAVDTRHLKATAIDGMVITGATVRTAASGARVVLDDTGLKAYNSSGVLTSAIYGASGDFTGASFSGGSVDGTTITGGVVRTSASTSRLQIDTSYGGQIYAMSSGIVRNRLSVNNGLEFFTTAGVQQGYVRGDLDRLSVWSNQRVSVLAPDVTIGYSAAANAKVQLSATGQILLSGNGASQIDMTGGGIYSTSTWFEMKVIGPSSPRNSWVIRPVTIGGVNRAMLYFMGGSANMPSTTIASNLMMDTNGAVWLSTSARRFKTDIRDVGVDPSLVLNARVRDWVDATAVADDPNYAVRTPGVVAEELEDAGLGMFVTYNSDGTTSGVMYDRLGLLLIPVVRELRERLERLENRP